MEPQNTTSTTGTEPVVTVSAPTATLDEVKRRIAREEISEAIARGLTIIEACRLSGISRQTFYNWLDSDDLFRRHIAYAEEEAASEFEAVLFRCAEKAMEDSKFQRSMIYYLERRERRRERQADREHRAELLRMKQEHELRMLQAAAQPAPGPVPEPATIPAAEPPSPPSPDTPHEPPATPPPSIYRPDSNVPLHLRPLRHLYHAAPGPIKRPEPPLLSSCTGDGHASALPDIVQNVKPVTIRRPEPPPPAPRC